MDASDARPRSSDAQVISLVGFAHGTSHFFHLVVPSLFPWLMADFGLSFTRAGTLSATFFLVSGVGQALAGFVVDRYGPRRVLATGLGLFALSAMVLALARGYPMLLAAAMLAGAGNAVFHPADFTILNRRVSPGRLGHAFSAHGLSGNLGWAVAPVLMTGMAAGPGWRAAAAVAGGVALAALLSLALLRQVVAAPAPAAGREAAGGGAASPFAFLGAGAVWMCFLFFFASTMGFGALQNFAPSVLRNVYGLSLTASASALTSYLLGGAAGIAAGGFLASRFQAHERVVAALLVAAALLALALAWGALPATAVAPLMALIGFCTGTATPSRDLLVRRAAMERFGQRSFGRVYGFVYSGLDVGLSAAPVLFGRLMDRQQFQAVLAGVALFQGLAVLAALRVGRVPAAEEARRVST
ncbi:MAG TPA: MFS transporter [Anaeromyxobacteraceae bacterium]|nr:MFS transporter [Anaeromyxobacteraceae bacterium]